MVTPNTEICNMKSEEVLQLGYNFHIWLLNSGFNFYNKKLL